MLGNSRWLWGRFCFSQKQETGLRFHIMAFEAAGGAPQEVLYDRMKTAVKSEAEDGIITYSRSLVALLDHYDTGPRACRPYRTKTKGKVERPFRHIRQDFFLDRTFRSLDDLNAQFADWVSRIANVRLHGTTNASDGVDAPGHNFVVHPPSPHCLTKDQNARRGEFPHQHARKIC